jgi:hypothetical protein
MRKDPPPLFNLLSCVLLEAGSALGAAARLEVELLSVLSRFRGTVIDKG